MRSLRRSFVLLVAVLLLTACGESSDSTDDLVATPEPAGPGTADGLVLRVELTGGFTTPAMLAARVPTVSVYGDGLVLSEGAQIAIWPAPALPNIQAGRISRDDVQRLVNLAQEAGVTSEPDLGQPPVADATSTRFTLVTADGTSVLEALALTDLDGGADQLDAAQQEARTKLRTLLDQLTDLPGTLGADAVTEEGAYKPSALAIYAEPYVAPGEDAPQQPELAWPGPALPGEPMGASGLTCLTASGAEAGAVLDAAKAANSATPWTDRQKRWSVTLRPLLPDETSCSDVSGSREGAAP
jgi:hypothetical protein